MEKRKLDAILRKNKFRKSDSKFEDFFEKIRHYNRSRIEVMCCNSSGAHVHSRYEKEFYPTSIKGGIELLEYLDDQCKELSKAGYETFFSWDKKEGKCYLSNRSTISTEQQFEDLVKAFGSLVK